MSLLYDFIYILGMLFSGVYCYVFYKDKDRGISKSILIVFFGLLGFILLESYASMHKINLLRYISFLPAHGSKLLLGPLLIVYIKSLFMDDNEVLKTNKTYFIPFLLFFLFVSIPYLIAILSKDYFLEYAGFLYGNNFQIRILLDSAFLLFLWKGFQTFYKSKRILKCNYSQIEHNNFIWVRYLLIATTTIISIDILFASYQLLFTPFSWRSQSLVMFLLGLSIIYGAYYGLKQSKVLVPYFLLEDDANIVSDKKVISKSQETEFKELEQVLVNFMSAEKPYLDEELTLNKLALAIGTTDKKLSALLNQYIQTPFYNFVNTYRIKEFKENISAPAYKEYTIEGIAYECGFKSKASFYRLFKKETGQSPSEFKKNC